MKSQENLSEEERQNIRNNFGRFTTAILMKEKVNELVKDELVPFLEDPESFLIKEKFGGVSRDETIETISLWVKDHLEHYL